MIIDKSFYAPSRETWRAWLTGHAAAETEVWLIYSKAGTGQPSIPYEDSVEEALCFGWIDSLIKRIDEQKYARKFTPRRPGSAWSDTNKRRVAKIIREGRMTAAGLDRIDYPLEEPPPLPVRKELVIPEWLADGLRASPRAWENFKKLPPSHQRRYAGWISNAKKNETRQRRIQAAIGLLEKNERLGLK
jgi:uncharacterized protein YdeI (YjbR/CyaY-like superfamily)